LGAQVHPARTPFVICDEACEFMLKPCQIASFAISLSAFTHRENPMEPLARTALLLAPKRPVNVVTFESSRVNLGVDGLFMRRDGMEHIATLGSESSAAQESDR
jgi:hypothetical protein